MQDFILPVMEGYKIRLQEARRIAAAFLSGCDRGYGYPRRKGGVAKLCPFHEFWEVEEMEVQLYEHNQAAYDAAVELMAQTGKAAIIHPTGTGKSFIGFRLCADHAGQKILWISPSEYIFKTQMENLKAATGGEIPDNITFCTYAKLTWMEEEEMAAICTDDEPAALSAENMPSGDMSDSSRKGENKAPAFIILDEFHRCGAQMWGQGVQKLLTIFAGTPILGLSATNIRYLDNRRDMAEELFDGNIASEITLGEAIVRGILNPPKYVLSVYSWQNSLEKYEQRVKTTRNRVVRDTAERYLEELKRALEMSEGLDEIFDKHMKNRTGKYIVFCSSKEHMDEMMGHLEWFAKVDPHPHVYSLYSNDPGSDQAFDDFRADSDTSHLRLLYCIDALNEGIHVEGISGVILLRPTVSPIIYKQQIGRALSASKSTDAIIFDIVLNLNCLDSIGLIEEEMQLVTSYYRDLGESEYIVNEHFRIIDEVRDCRELFSKLNDTLSASWDLMYSLAKAYYEEHGNLDMLASYRTEDGYPLGHWVATQRGIRKGKTHGCLTAERIRKLDAIGMSWESVPDRQWEKSYRAAKEYYGEHGNLNVTWNYVTKEGIHLGEWLNTLRCCKKTGARQNYLTEERAKKMDEIGMIWGKYDYFWERNYQAAAAYYKEHGNLNLPVSYVNADGIKLGSWVWRIRKERNKNSQNREREDQKTLTEEQIRRLDQIGMVWDHSNESKWEKGYREAEAYAAVHGNLLVPARYATEDGFRLGNWISNQRHQFQKNKLSEQRIAKLDALGMAWQAPAWKNHYQLAKTWYEEHGSLAIPQNTVIDGVWIGKWLVMQKKALEEGKLDEGQKKLLSELPMEEVAKKKKAPGNGCRKTGT